MFLTGILDVYVMGIFIYVVGIYVCVCLVLASMSCPQKSRTRPYHFIRMPTRIFLGWLVALAAVFLFLEFWVRFEWWWGKVTWQIPMHLGYMYVS